MENGFDQVRKSPKRRRASPEHCQAWSNNAIINKSDRKPGQPEQIPSLITRHETSMAIGNANAVQIGVDALDPAIQDTSTLAIRETRPRVSHPWADKGTPRGKVARQAPIKKVPIACDGVMLARRQSDLWWSSHEITGFGIDQDDSGDDGEGINGVGFIPTPAMSYARAQIRRTQLDEYKARESREARTMRGESRLKGRNGNPPLIGRGAADDIKYRRVHFANS